MSEIYASQAETPATLERLSSEYDSWSELNNTLISGEFIFTSDFDPIQHQDELRQQISKTAIELYQLRSSDANFKNEITDMLISSPNTLKNIKDFYIADPLVATQMNPVFGKDESTPSPAEALISSAKNLEIANHHAEVLGDLCEGIAMSGSTAWGTFYATRNNRPELKGLNKPSDIDLIIETADIGAGWQCIEKYIDEGLLDKEELERYELFSKMYLRDEADIFSARSLETGTEVSLHFVSSQVMPMITDPNQAARHNKARNQKIDYIRDFRPRSKSLISGQKSYQLFDFLGLSDIKIQPKVSEVVKDFKIYGCISESPLGSIIETKHGEKSYAIGVLPFFIGIHPVVISDKNMKMAKNINTFQQNVGKILEGKPPTQIYRQERMPEYIRTKVVDALTYNHG